jgi:hypothetical protein
METNLMNNQNAFAFNNNQSMFGNFARAVPARKAMKKKVGGLFGTVRNDNGTEPDIPPKSTFRIAI